MADPSHLLVLARIVQHLARQTSPGLHDDDLDALLIALDPSVEKKGDEAIEKTRGGRGAH